MNYTQQRRRSMNKNVRAMYPNIKFYESTCGVPVMECSKLPKGACLVTDENRFINQVKEFCTHTNEMGVQIPDNNKAYPVFVLSKELNGSQTSYYYRVNYVSCSTESLEQASKYIAEKLLYTAPAQDICNP